MTKTKVLFGGLGVITLTAIAVLSTARQLLADCFDLGNANCGSYALVDCGNCGDCANDAAEIWPAPVDNYCLPGDPNSDLTYNQCVPDPTAQPEICTFSRACATAYLTTGDCNGYNRWCIPSIATPMTTGSVYTPNQLAGEPCQAQE